MATINGRPGTPRAEITTVLQNAAAATGNGTALTLDAGTEELLIIATGASTPTGITVEHEYSRDGGTTWLAGYAEDLINVALALVTQIVVTASEQRFLFQPPPGTNRFRARVSARVAGSVTVTAIERRQG